MPGNVRLRLTFKEWSRIAGEDPAALPIVREWLANCERKIEAISDKFWDPFLNGTGVEAKPFAGLESRHGREASPP